MLVMPDGKPQAYTPSGMIGWTNVAKYQRQDAFRPQRDRIVDQVMSRPETLDQTWQDQQNEMNKESAQRMTDQQKGQYQQSQVGRGFNVNSRPTQAVLGGYDNNLVQTLLQGRRDVAQRAAQTNRQDQINAANLGQQMDMQDNQMNLGIHNANMQNELARNQYELAKWQANEQAKQFGSTFNANNWLEQARLAQQAEQFGLGQDIDWARVNEGARQFNQQMGYQWNRAGQNDMNSFLNFLMGRPG